jgi:hypothetical protein
LCVPVSPLRQSAQSLSFKCCLVLGRSWIRNIVSVSRTPLLRQRLLNHTPNPPRTSGASSSQRLV